MSALIRAFISALITALISALIRALLTRAFHILDGAYAEAVLLQVGLDQLCRGGAKTAQDTRSPQQRLHAGNSHCRILTVSPACPTGDKVSRT